MLPETVAGTGSPVGTSSASVRNTLRLVARQSAVAAASWSRRSDENRVSYWAKPSS